MRCCQLVVTFPQPCATSCNSHWRSSKAKRDSLLATMNLLADPAAPIRGRARDVDPRQPYLTVLNGQTDGRRWTCALRSILPLIEHWNSVPLPGQIWNSGFRIVGYFSSPPWTSLDVGGRTHSPPNLGVTGRYSLRSGADGTRMRLRRGGSVSY